MLTGGPLRLHQASLLTFGLLMVSCLTCELIPRSLAWFICSALEREQDLGSCAMPLTLMVRFS